jgi:glycosyltransferase involved in cell wall biosynthesis
MLDPARVPFLSVVVAVDRPTAKLDRALGALGASDLPRDCWELIVVVEGDNSDAELTAAAHADAVVRLPGSSRGTAYGRNRGADVASGEVLLFIDQDVAVLPDALRRVAVAFAADPDRAALVGTFDANERGSGLVTEYRTLLRHFTQLESGDETGAFWASCGAVRRSAFVAAGAFDEWLFVRSLAADIEFGTRLRALGHRIILRSEVCVIDLREWTVPTAFASDFRDGGVPWMRLVMRERPRRPPDRLGLRSIEKINIAASWIGAVTLGIGAVVGDPRWVMTSVVAILPALFTNRHLYGFLQRKRGFWFAVRSIPLHLGYHILLGVALGLGWLLHVVIGDPRPEPIMEAYAEVGAEMWPPVPAKRLDLPAPAIPT